MVEDRLTVEQDIAPHEGEILSAEVAFDHLDWIDADHGEAVEVELRAVIGLHVDVRRFVGEPSLSEPDIAGSPGDRQGAGLLSAGKVRQHPGYLCALLCA